MLTQVSLCESAILHQFLFFQVINFASDMLGSQSRPLKIRMIIWFEQTFGGTELEDGVK